MKINKRMQSFHLRVVKWAHSRIGHYLNSIRKNEELEADRQWQHLFDGNNSYDHKMHDQIKIRLFKDNALSRLIYNGFESDELEFTRKYLRNGDFFLDIGCNIGLFSLTAAPLVGEKGKIICFEPSPLTFTRLLENISLNGFKNIFPINIGLSDKDTVLKFNISNNGYDAWNTFAPSVELEKLQESINVEVSTLDKQLGNVEKEKISLIKIDVEGWEKFVLKGGERLFKDFDPVVMIEFTESNTFAAGYFVQELYDILFDWGYKWYRLEGNGVKPETKRIHYPYDNLIAIKDIGKAMQRVQGN
jgi:FkbM family methyltransferase